MKQVPITPVIAQRLKAAAGADVNPDNLAVYEAMALSTAPIRKKHTLFYGGTHTRNFLSQMSAQLNSESLPLQIMHNSDPLPVGRVFYGEVLDAANGPELRVLFWVDKTNPDVVNLVDNGTVDQVSVSVLAAAASCSACGFDFFGADSTIDNLWTGTDPEGHTMGVNGAHAIMDNLSAWHEMSLVGRGGAQGARIVSRENSKLLDHTRLAASGTDASFMTLTLSASSDLENPSMNVDVNKLITDLSDARGQQISLQTQLTASAAQVTAVQAEVATLTASVADLTTKLAEANSAVAPKDTQISELTESLAGAEKIVRDTASKLLALSGDATTKVDDMELAKVVELIASKSADMKLSFAAAGTQPATDPAKLASKPSSAFKRAR